MWYNKGYGKQQSTKNTVDETTVQSRIRKKAIHRMIATILISLVLVFAALKLGGSRASGLPT